MSTLTLQPVPWKIDAHVGGDGRLALDVVVLVDDVELTRWTLPLPDLEVLCRHLLGATVEMRAAQAFADDMDVTDDVRGAYLAVQARLAMARYEANVAAA